MHDLYEGIVPRELQLILRSLVSEGLFPKHDVNLLLKSFPFHGSDLTKRPSSTGPNLKVKGSSSQTSCFLRLFGLLFGHKVPMGDVHYELWVLLRYLHDFAFSPRFRKYANDVSSFRSACENHLAAFVALFPDVSVTPKLHNTLHYAELVLKFGPLTNLQCMRFEAVHERGKRIASVTRNFKNAQFSLAYKYQLASCFEKLSDKFISDNIQLQRPRVVADASLPETVRSFLSMRGLCANAVLHSLSASVNSISYRRQYCVLLDVASTGKPRFGNILGCYQVGDIVLLFCQLTEVEFSRHFQAYSLRLLQTFHVTRLQDLYDHNPLPIYHVHGTQFIVPNYFYCVSEIFWMTTSHCLQNETIFEHLNALSTVTCKPIGDVALIYLHFI